jgi:hypothetical protein
MQNVERQNVQRQNVENKMSTIKKRRQLQNVEILFLLAAIYKNKYWFMDHKMKCICNPNLIS